MSFGWSAGDIVSAITVIVKISKGLRETGGAATSYQENAEFLSSLAVTLEGINTLISKNAHLTWEQALISQAQRLKDATETCVDKANKYEASLGAGSQKSKLGKAPRKVQWTLFKDSIEELKVSAGRTMGVMNDLILLQSLDSILELSKTSSLSFDELKKLSEGLAQLLPSVRDSLTTLGEEIKADSEASKSKITALEAQFSMGIQDLRTDMTHLGLLKDFMDRQEQRQETDRELWQQDLANTASSLQSATKAHLELQLHDLKSSIREIVEDEVSKRLPEADQGPTLYASALQIMGSGVAATLGAFIALTVHNSMAHVNKPFGAVPSSQPRSQPRSKPSLLTAKVKPTLPNPTITSRAADSVLTTPWLWSKEHQDFYQSDKDSSGKLQTRRKEHDVLYSEQLKNEFLAQENLSAAPTWIAPSSSNGTEREALQIKQNISNSFATTSSSTRPEPPKESAPVPSTTATSMTKSSSPHTVDSQKQDPPTKPTPVSSSAAKSASTPPSSSTITTEIRNLTSLPTNLKSTKSTGASTSRSSTAYDPASTYYSSGAYARGYSEGNSYNYSGRYSSSSYARDREEEEREESRKRASERRKREDREGQERKDKREKKRVEEKRRKENELAIMTGYIIGCHNRETDRSDLSKLEIDEEDY